ncbi:MAG: hypothetical protein AB7E52_02565 [Bdellovibrionales bacterium]
MIFAPVIIPFEAEQEPCDKPPDQYVYTSKAFALLCNELTVARNTSGVIECTGGGSQDDHGYINYDSIVLHIINASVDDVISRAHRYTFLMTKQRDFNAEPLTVKSAKEYLTRGFLYLPTCEYGLLTSDPEKLSRADERAQKVFNVLLAKTIQGKPDDQPITVRDLVEGCTRTTTPWEDPVRVYYASLDRR